jgi:FKBP-type peptidyl-prolyl cis-trans isomerase
MNKEINYQKGNMSVAVAFVIVIAAILCVIYILMRKPADSGTLSQREKAPAILNTNTSMDTQQVRAAKNGDSLVMNYTGRLTDGTVFDSNVDPAFRHVQPFEFTLGRGMVIAGWDEGLVGMKVGEKKTLTIPPEKGYGSRGQGPIPPNATLIFDVELVGIK